MLKIIGVACIVLGAGTIGFRCAGTLRRQAQQLAELQTALCFMKNEILCRLTPLPELLHRAGEETNGAVARLFFRLSERMKAEPHAAPQTLFSQTAKELPSLQLPAPAQRAMLGLFMAFGQFDAQGQCRSIDLADARLREQAELLEKARSAQSRSYRTVAVCAGLAIAVILL